MLDRALGALVGGAIGDALGMPTQLLSPAQIKASYGFVDSFISPSDDHPVSKGLSAGTITDDTEQALLLGRILLESGGSFDHKRWVNALIAWERDVKLRGSYDLLGPSTKRAIDAINSGVRARASRARRRYQRCGNADRARRPHDAGHSTWSAGRQGGRDLPGNTQYLDRHRGGSGGGGSGQSWRRWRGLA